MMQADEPLVSVLIAAYNAEGTIAETITSAVGQTYPNVEVVVVDDGSADRTLVIAREYEAAHSGVVRVIAQENQGACAARNRAFEASCGSFVQFLDADDVLHPEKLSLQVRRLLREPEGTVASGPWVRFHGAVADADHTWSGPDWQDYEPATGWLLQFWSQGGGMPTVVWLTPRSVGEAAGPWNESVLRNQDGEYFTRVVAAARKVAFCDGAWGYYRSSPESSISNRRSDAALRSLYEVAELNEAALLSREDTAESRRACGAMWEGVAFKLYPRLPDLSRKAEERARKLGAPPRTPSTIPSVRPILRLFGWKAALRVQHVYNFVRYGRK